MITTIWQVDFDNSTHIARLDYNNMLNLVSISLDDRPYLSNKFFLYLSKNIHHFTVNNHTFDFHKSGITTFDMKFSLIFDGREIPPSSAESSLFPTSINGFIASFTPQTGAPPPQAPPPAIPPAPTPIQIVGQGPITETTEIVARDEYPLDNRFGDEVLSIEQEVSRTVANEISLSHEMQASAGGNFELFSYIKADLSAQYTRQTGVKVNDTVTRRQTIKFSAGAHQFVIYSVVWKRRVSEGTCYVSMQNTVQPIPYRVAFDLSFEIASRLGAS